ncbi:MAG: rRNA maturation RNase YbeY [Erysipelotrichaceae bacterium]|nr:rRNA maturation RNase YbeY [Erysipelotrichaceae bacterium]
MDIEMSFYNETNYEKYNEEYFFNLAQVIFNHLKLNNYFIFDITIVTLDEIHRINKEYRNIDRPTDVISFAFEDEVEGENKIIRNDNLPRTLGEIFICYEKCQMQSEEYGHSLDREMAFLFTHGLLHLLGYDHMNEEDEKIMFKIQDEIMDLLKL